MFNNIPLTYELNNELICSNLILHTIFHKLGLVSLVRFGKDRKDSILFSFILYFIFFEKDSKCPVMCSNEILPLFQIYNDE